MRFVIQQAPGAHRAVLTGLEAAADRAAVFISCTNDIVPDDTYRRLARAPGAGPIRVVASTLTQTFVGGMLVLDETSGVVREIVERPPGGCPPGSSANVFIHRVEGPGLIRGLVAALERLDDYELAINHFIQMGVAVTAVNTAPWVAIKTPGDVQRALAVFGVRTGSSLEDGGAD